MAEEREHAVDRFTTFADAVVAIAITLLALPLIDLAPKATGGFAHWWQLTWSPLLGFLISFAVIARLWWAHHRVFQRVVRLDLPLLISTFVWLLTIVLVSAATAVTTSVQPGEPGTGWAFAVYVGVMIASGVALLVQAVVVLRVPAVTGGGDPEALRHVVGLAETVAGFALALVIGLLLPGVNYLALLILAFTGRLDRPIARRLERRRGVR